MQYLSKKLKKVEIKYEKKGTYN